VSVNPEVSCWAHVAARTNGRLQIRHVFKGPRQARKRFGLPSLEADLHGIRVQGEVTGEGDPPATFALLSARVPSAIGLKLRIYRNYLVPQVGAGVGREGLATGAPHFDRNFIVNSADPAYARIWLTAQSRETILAAPDFAFEIDNCRVTASSYRADDAAQIEAALNALALLAKRGTELNSQIRSLAQRLGSDSRIGETPWLEGGSPEFEFISGGRRVSVSFEHGRTNRRATRRLLSKLWCRRLTARSDRFVFYADSLGRKERPLLATKLARCHLGPLHPPGYIVHASNRERLTQRLTETWARTMARLGPLVFSCSEAAVEFVWPGAMLREQLLRDAAGLCEYFAVERHGVVSKGPYR
tara:strand:- start:68230 stop:69303 length:1074 start_codon:yes stop_codon:yes gene_type:complete